MAERFLDAVRVAIPFHVVRWATGTLHVERRTAWNRARKVAQENEPARGRGWPAKDASPRPDSERAAKLRNCRFALWKNREDLTDKQQVKLARSVETAPVLGRAYYLKERLRTIFKLPTQTPWWHWIVG